MKKQIIFANTVLKSLIIISFSILSYALWESSTHSQHNVLKYYILSISGISLFAYVLLKCSQDLKAKVSLLALSVIISLYTVEISLIFIDLNTRKNEEDHVRHPIYELADYYGLPYDKRSKLQVVTDLRENGLDVYPFGNYFVSLFGRGKLESMELVPLGLISHKKIVFCNESGEYLTYETDEHGFNNPVGIHDEKILDFILIGDSFTNGECVDREENIAGWLSKEGRKVLNLGMSNTGPLNQLAILKEYGKTHNPRTVLWFYFEGNDYYELLMEKKSPFLMNYFDKKFSQNLISQQDKVDALLIPLMEERIKQDKEKKEINSEHKINKQSIKISLSNIKLYQLRKQLGVAKDCASTIDPLFRNILVEAKETITNTGGQLYFVYLPSQERYLSTSSLCDKRIRSTRKDSVLSLVKNLGIPVLDVQSDFDSYIDPPSLFPFRAGGHYNSKGYHLIAKRILKLIEFKKILLLQDMAFPRRE